MRFFCIACFFGIVVASIGCMTRNWSTPLFNKNRTDQQQELLPFQSSGAMERQLFGPSKKVPSDRNSGGVPNFVTTAVPDF